MRLCPPPKIFVRGQIMSMVWIGCAWTWFENCAFHISAPPHSHTSTSPHLHTAALPQFHICTRPTSTSPHLHIHTRPHLTPSHLRTSAIPLSDFSCKVKSSPLSCRRCFQQKTFCSSIYSKHIFCETQYQQQKQMPLPSSSAFLRLEHNLTRLCRDKDEQMKIRKGSAIPWDHHSHP